MNRSRLSRTKEHAPPRQRPKEKPFLAFQAAGFTEEQALDVVLGVGVYVLSTFANRVTCAEIDAPFAAFAWRCD